MIIQIVQLNYLLCNFLFHFLPLHYIIIIVTLSFTSSYIIFHFLLRYLQVLVTLYSSFCYVIFKFLLHYLTYFLLCLPDMFYSDSSCSATDIALLPSRRLLAASHPAPAPVKLAPAPVKLASGPGQAPNLLRGHAHRVELGRERFHRIVGTLCSSLLSGPRPPTLRVRP